MQQKKPTSLEVGFIFYKDVYYPLNSPIATNFS